MTRNLRWSRRWIMNVSSNPIWKRAWPPHHCWGFQLIKWHNIFTTLISLIKFHFIAKSFGINLLCVHSFCTMWSNHFWSPNWLFLFTWFHEFLFMSFQSLCCELSMLKKMQIQNDFGSIINTFKILIWFQHCCTCHFD